MGGWPLVDIRAGGRGVRGDDTDEHRVGGFFPRQSGGQGLTFSRQNGTVRMEDLKEV